MIKLLSIKSDDNINRQVEADTNDINQGMFNYELPLLLGTSTASSNSTKKISPYFEPEVDVCKKN